MKEPKLRVNIARNVYHLKIRETDIPAWIKQLAVKKGIKMTGSSVECLIESIGPDVGLLVMEVEKLVLSGLKTIDAKDIISSTGMTREYMPFNLVDSLIAGQKTRAFRILKNLIKGSPSGAPTIVGALNWHYKQFYTLWKNKGRRPLKMNDSTFKKLVRHLPSFTQEKFSRIFQSLHEADVYIKTSGRPDLALEVLLIKLLQARTKS